MYITGDVRARLHLAQRGNFTCCAHNPLFFPDSHCFPSRSQISQEGTGARNSRLQIQRSTRRCDFPGRRFPRNSRGDFSFGARARYTSATRNARVLRNPAETKEQTARASASCNAKKYTRPFATFATHYHNVRQSRRRKLHTVLSIAFTKQCEYSECID